MPAMTATLTTSGTVYNLYALIKASFPNAAGACRELTILGGPGNEAAKVFIGGNDVTSSNFGQQLIAGQGTTYRSDRNNIPMSNMGLTSDTNAAKVDIQWMYA